MKTLIAIILTSLTLTAGELCDIKRERTNGWITFTISPKDYDLRTNVIETNYSRVRFEGGPFINPPLDITNVIRQLVVSGEICKSIGHHWSPIGLHMSDDSGNSDETFLCLTCSMYKEVKVKISKQRP